MTEEIDLDNVGAAVMWLVSSIKGDSSTTKSAESTTLCRLNDYSEFEMYELKQAIDGEDRF